MIILEILKFSIFLFFVVFVTGSVLVNRLKLKGALAVFLALCLGIVITTLAAFVNIYLVLALAGVSAYFYIRGLDLNELKNFRQKVNPATLIIAVIILGGVIFQNALTFKSGTTYNFGIGYWGPLGHDGVWHQALVNQLIKATPPGNPGLSGTTLSNYHYFYDLLVATTAHMSGVPVADLIFRFYPILFSFLLGLGTYLLCKALFNKWYVGAASLFFVYFGGSFGYILEWIKGGFWGGESAFWANQPVSMNLNPPFAVSLVLLIAVVILFQIFEEKRNLASGLALILVSGTLIEFKVYAGAVALFSLGAIALVRALKKDFAYLKVFVPALILALLVFLPNNSASAGLIVFSPFWLVDSMVDFADRVGWVRLSQARASYLSGGLWPKYVLAEILALAIFVVGNLGTRVVALVGLPGLFKKKFWKSPTLLFIAFLSASSFIPTLLFIQKGNPWNTIQFIYYFLYFCAVFAGLGLVVLAKSLPKYLAILAIALVLLATPLSSLSTFRSAFQGAPARVTPDESAALSFLGIQPDGVVLTHPFNKDLRSKYSSPFPLAVYETSAYVSAFSKKETFVEDEFQQEIFQNDYKGRLADSNKFFYGKDYGWDKVFLLENKISYIYLPTLYKLNLNEGLLGVEKIFSNSEAEIFKVRQ